MTLTEITADRVRDLLRDQHPDLAGLPLCESRCRTASLSC